MDPELLKQRQAFIKKVSSTPTITSKASRKDSAPNFSIDGPSKTKDSGSSSKGIKASRITAAGLRKATTNVQLKNVSSTADVANFGLLAKIVDHMKKRHIIEQQTWGLSLEEILEELNFHDVSLLQKEWLLKVLTEGNNPRIGVEDNTESGGIEVDSKRFRYTAPFDVRNRASLLRLLKKRDQSGDGGILMSELADCVNNPEELVESLGDQVLKLDGVAEKKKDSVLFFGDPDRSVKIDEEFKSLWRTAAVDQMDERRIEEYLQRHGIDAMSDPNAKKKLLPMGPKRRKTRRGPQIVHNEHLAKQGLLTDYTLQ